MTMKNLNTFAHSLVNVPALALAAFAIVSLPLAAPTARAAEPSPDPVPTTTVKYGDLNLANAQGVERLYVRIAGAAQQVCRGLDGRSMEEKVQFSICTTQSIARAVAAVDQPALTALQAVKIGRPAVTTQLAKR
jgi:UrcA family protein